MDKRPQIKIETFIAAPRSEVWQAITDSSLVSEWLMETNIRPEKGFRGYFKMKPRPGFDGNIATEVLEVRENEVFAYTWESSWMKKPTTVQFTLIEQVDPDGSGRSGTLLRLEHWGFEGFLGGLLRRMMRGGWKKMVTRRIPAVVGRLYGHFDRSPSAVADGRSGEISGT
jgi:uncharacterized protein YndB with AHSA1/START domain